jgi:hypothetical protein
MRAVIDHEILGLYPEKQFLSEENRKTALNGRTMENNLREL